MNYNLEIENKKAQQFVKDGTMAFKPEDAVLVDALKESAQHASGEHYTFSCLVPSDLRGKLEPITEQLRTIDPTLVLNEPELYHLTVFWCNLDQDIDSLISLFKKHLAEKPLAFHLSGLVGLPFGISLKAYPLNETFFNLRQELWAATGQVPPLNSDGSLHERAVSTWITLGRYANPPSQALLNYLQENLDLDMGQFTPDSFGVYLSDNKYLRNPKTIEIVKNG